MLEAMPIKKVVLTTSLNRLRAANACAPRYKVLVEALGGTSFDHDAPINLLKILETNGVEDCLWALCATKQNCDVVARLMAADFAAAVLPIFEKHYPKDKRPRKTIAAARAFARGKITREELDAAWATTRDAAWDAAWATTWDAAWDAAWATTRDAAWDAARAAARAATRAAVWDAWDAVRAAVWDAQAQIIRKYLR